MFDWSGDTSLAALFIAAFVSATVLPANSEIVLVAVLNAHPDRVVAAIALATLGNTLGGITTYGLGRLLPQSPSPLGEGRVRVNPRALAMLRRHGAWALLLSWVPIVGDALCAAAGWLRVPFLASVAAIAAGKLARYLAVAQLAALL
jgi:membrane protein YqaA with SNARE-associated domain